MSDLKYPFLDLRAVNEQYFEDLKRAAARVIESGRYIGGAEVATFEQRLASMCQAPWAVGVSNGLDALRLILEGYKALGRLNEGDAVIVPANTYIASVLAISHAGLRPVLVDPDYQSMNLTAKAVADAIDENTKAVMPVHLYGRVAWDEEMARIVIDAGLLVIEDAAQAIGARATTDGLFGSPMAGALGHAGAFSFYPTKNVGALGDAGAVVTHDRDLAEAVRALANYGSDRRYHNIYVGFNCRMDPIQAAMIDVKLDDAIDEAARRFAKAAIYNRHIKHPDIRLPELTATLTDCVWHQYVVRVGSGRRDEFRQYLETQGVGSDIHYSTPPHMQPCYAALEHRPLPVTERLASEIVSLPIGEGTDEKAAREISEIINQF